MNIDQAKAQRAPSTNTATTAAKTSAAQENPAEPIEKLVSEANTASTTEKIHLVAQKIKKELQKIDKKDKGLAGRLTGTKTSKIINDLKAAIQLLIKKKGQINTDDIATAEKWSKTNFEIGNAKGSPQKIIKNQLGMTAKILLGKVADDLKKRKAEHQKTNAPNKATHPQVTIRPAEPTHATLQETQPQSIKERLEEDYIVLAEVGIGQSTKTGEKEQPNRKNRYKNILPFDKNRVQVSKNYINASEMKLNGTTKYIASQGPTEGTTADHLTMLFETKSPVTVMLTNLVEKGRVKCHQYWTPGKFKNSAGKQVQVELSSEEPHDKHIERKLRITIGGETHEVTQLHYTAWPDHGVPSPENTDNFNKFVDRFNELEDPKTPSVIHCSAGVGRTGTFIAVDQLKKDTSQQPPEVTLQQIATKMREDRTSMIQTIDQYKFAYEAAVQAQEAQQAQITPQAPQNPAITTITTTEQQTLFGQEYDDGKQDVLIIPAGTHQYNQETHTLITEDNKEIPLPNNYEVNTKTGEFEERDPSPAISFEGTHATLPGMRRPT